MKKIKSLCCIALMGATLTSCNDFLTLMPLNEIVLENFWTDKSDVESVLLGAYAALETSDCVLRMSIWGEMRSDNIIGGNNPSDDILQITKDNILETNSYTTYKCFYDVINRANTVLHFAPIVADQDPNFTGAELQATEAEAVTLRCLCYWYLIRAYKDVPYTTIPSIDDTHDFFIGQTPFNQVLDSLISDLERVEKYAVNRYTLESANTGRITRAAIHAMLADMYLWKAEDYDLKQSNPAQVQLYLDKCIEHSEWVIARKNVEFAELKEKKGSDCIVEEFGEGKYPLITELYRSNGMTVQGNVYNELYGKGNSFEILFELPFDKEVSNPFVGSYYSENSNNSLRFGSLYAANEVASGFGGGRSNKVFTQAFDCRYYHNVKQVSTDGSDYGIVKYAYEDMKFDLTTGTVSSFQGSLRNNTSPNWVIYKFTDVLLMEAEAYMLKSKALGSGDTSNVQKQEYINKSFQLIDAVNQRAISKNSSGLLKATDYVTDEALENLILAERRRELLFEGKRWFDLVRKSRGDGNTRKLSSYVLTKYDASTSSAVRIKLTDLNAMYFPLSKDEIKINSLLKQNPVYIEDEDIQKAQ